jgi:hypothetical protein
MSAFTILGVLFFWIFCWELGYHIAMALDAKSRFEDLIGPVAYELEVLVSMLPKEVE